MMGVISAEHLGTARSRKASNHYINPDLDARTRRFFMRREVIALIEFGTDRWFIWGSLDWRQL